MSKLIDELKSHAGFPGIFKDVLADLEGRLGAVEKKLTELDGRIGVSRKKTGRNAGAENQSPEEMRIDF